MERDFKGIWIPKAIWLDERLNALEKVIFAEIDSLDQSESGCYASNKYIAEFCQCSEVKASRAISKLIKMGYLKLANFDGRTRILKSCLVENESLPYQKDKAESSKRQGTTIKNNTVINIDDNTASEIQSVFDMYHEICVSLPKVKLITAGRKTAVKAKLKQHGIEKIKEVFTKAEASDFLTGKVNSFKAGFDWIMKEANFAKIIEGNYDNRKAEKQTDIPSDDDYDFSNFLRG